MTKSERRRKLLKTLLEFHPDPVDIEDLGMEGEKPALVRSYVDAAVEAGQVLFDESFCASLTERGVAAATIANPGAASKSIKRAKAAKKAKRAEPKTERKAPRKKANPKAAKPKADPKKVSMAKAKQGTMKPKTADLSAPRTGRSKLTVDQASLTRGMNVKVHSSILPASWTHAEPLWSHERGGIEIAKSGPSGVKVQREGALAAMQIRRAARDGKLLGDDKKLLDCYAGIHAASLEDGVLFIDIRKLDEDA